MEFGYLLAFLIGLLIGALLERARLGRTPR